MCCAEDIDDAVASFKVLLDKEDGIIQPVVVKAAPSPRMVSTSCQNRSIVSRKRKQLRVGRSTIEGAGFGLFTDEKILKDEFVVEYVGEMVTQEEAERRGVIYDKLHCSYLFNLDAETVVDATRKGNKTRVCTSVSFYI